MLSIVSEAVKNCFASDKIFYDGNLVRPGDAESAVHWNTKSNNRRLSKERA